MNVAQFVNISPTVKNEVNESVPDFSQGYVEGVGLVFEVIAKELLQGLRTDDMQEAKFTDAIIQDKFQEDGGCDIPTTMLKVFLFVRWGKKKNQPL